VPWQYVGKDVWVCERAGQVEIYHASERIAAHDRASRHQVVTQFEHHRGIPLGSQSRGEKILIHVRETAPVVETRSLAAYESVADGGVR
jgi:hypothetical protein